MTKKQDGTERKHTRWPAGHKYPSNRKTMKENVTETSQASALCELEESSDEEATNSVDVDNTPSVVFLSAITIVPMITNLILIIYHS